MTCCCEFLKKVATARQEFTVAAGAELESFSAWPLSWALLLPLALPSQSVSGTQLVLAMDSAGTGSGYN